MQQLTDVPMLAGSPEKVLADSLHDLDITGGWTFCGRHRTGIVSAMEALRPSGEETLGDSYMMGSDPFAVFARDTLHPGHDLSPCLVYLARRDHRVRLLVRASPVLSKTVDELLVTARLGERVLAECQVGYGRIAQIDGTFD